MPTELEDELEELEYEREDGSRTTHESSWIGETTESEEELEKAATLYEGPRRPTAAAPGTASCPVPTQVARDRCIHPGTKTCPAIPNLLCLRDAAGVPFEYVQAIGVNGTTRLKIVTSRKVPAVQRFIPAVRNALSVFIGNMSRFGMPIEAILTLGSLYCRCVSGSDHLSNHSFGDAIDIAGVRWPPVGGPASRLRETIVHNWLDTDQRMLLGRINACLRLSFNTVIDYHRSDHRDHFHCDTNATGGSARAMGRSTTTPQFVQEALTHVLGRRIPETGQWDNVTMRGLQDFSGVSVERLKDKRQLNEVLNQLFTQVASGQGRNIAPGGAMGLDQFSFDSPILTPYHERLIDRIGKRVVVSWSTPTPIRVIRLVGHADSCGSISYNQRLGLRRARAVQTAIARVIERIRPGTSKGIRFLIGSLGSTKPVAPSQTQGGRARNRRVTVTLNLPPTAYNRQAESLEYEGLLEAPPPAIPVPPLLYSESTVPAETHYLKITLGKESPAPPMTGIFVPADYKIRSQVDMLLYLQGHHQGGTYPANLPIDVYWLSSHYPFWAFREGVNTSNKNLILVAPTLGPGSQAGKLTDSGGLAWYLDQVMRALRTYGPFKSMGDPPPLGNIIVACHSGGGLAMRHIAFTPQQYLAKVRQYWGFDCLYNAGDETLWAKWAKANRDKELFVYYGNGGTAARSQQLRANTRSSSNVSVDGSEKIEHNRVPITYWLKRIRAATFLRDK